MKQSNSTPSPLWRELNEARTQGEWKQGINRASKEWMQLFYGRTVVLEIHTINKKGQRQAGDFEKEDANVKYTALAVNNLASLAEALDAAIHDLKDWHEYNQMQVESFDGNERELQQSLADDIKERLIKVKTALAAIS